MQFLKHLYFIHNDAMKKIVCHSLNLWTWALMLFVVFRTIFLSGQLPFLLFRMVKCSPKTEPVLKPCSLLAVLN